MKNGFHVFSRMFTKFVCELRLTRLALCLCVMLFAVQAAVAKTTNLSTLESDYTAQNGDVLTGTLDGENQPYKISIADGATVTLDGVNINGDGNLSGQFAGLTCEGDCKIVLAEGSVNIVNAFAGSYPGIFVPEGKTLTIEGTGALDVCSEKKCSGIGGGYKMSCGNIVINGGTITATGGSYGAAIGGGRGEYGIDVSAGDIVINGGTIIATAGYGGVAIGGGVETSCGNITINGGTVTATGRLTGAVIGSADHGSCGNITIGGDAKVTATKHDLVTFSIGRGSGGNSSVGTITIGGMVTNNITQSPFTYPLESFYTVALDANGGGGAMVNTQIAHGLSTRLPVNKFTRDGYSFAGWNTARDGSGTFYPDEGFVLDLTPVAGATVTLYAQWQQGDSPRVDISKLVSDYVVRDGVVLTGTLEGSVQAYKISIADGATVTLDGVTINSIVPENTSQLPYHWAGITCEGDCKIVLADGSVNIVKSFGGWWHPGIHVQDGFTLTIDGSGTLNAGSDVVGARAGAGIGGDNKSCGNIVINGGIINATTLAINATNLAGYAASIGGANDMDDFFPVCGKIEINGGIVNATKIKDDEGNASWGPAIGYSEKIIINGGTVNATSNGEAIIGSFGYWLSGDDYDRGTIEINGGTVNATGIAGIAYFDNAIINGGTVTATGNSSQLGGIAANKNIVINDGTVTATGNVGIGGSGSNITINGGDVRAKGNLSAGIGAGRGSKESCGNITIAGGKVVAQGGGLDSKNYAAAIGGGNEGDIGQTTGSAGNITITGGEIIAHGGSGYAAAIGGGTSSRVGKITITGGNITAFADQGVTIGCRYGYCEDILISGGTVTAKSEWGAAIGGSDITIDGGTVTATTGYSYAAGIGSGGSEYYSCGNITINGGTVTATGGREGGAGIGSGGPKTVVGDIFINGGTVIATGLGEGAGIGGSSGRYNVSSVGNITITENVTKVVATGGPNAPYSVGRGWGYGKNSSVGTITVGGEVTGDIAGLFTYPKVPFTVVFNKNDGSGTEERQTLYIGNGEPLRRNTFTRDGFFFAGWNTAADGSGTAYGDGAAVPYMADREGVSVTLYAQWHSGVGIDISTLTGDYVVQDGYVLTGTLAGRFKISIADGATVTLDGVNINGNGNLTASGYYARNDDDVITAVVLPGDNAGLTCEGDCKIVLAEGSVNTVNGLHRYYPGIYVPEGKTLTIGGSGSLNAEGGKDTDGLIGDGAGIGGGYGMNCGNIVINGGSVTATGGDGAGIGGGDNSSCGNITITDNVTRVTAVKDKYAPYSIGKGKGDNSSVGTITIGGEVMESVSVSPYTYPKKEYTVVFDGNGGVGTMENQTFDVGLGEQSLNPNSYYREGYSFAGWNTAKDGSGDFYLDNMTMNLMDVAGKTVTLYAQWWNGDLSMLKADGGSYVAQDGYVLRGTLASVSKISIADGATVTLGGVSINADAEGMLSSKGMYSDKFAGLTCEGDCRIVLAEGSENTVKSFDYLYPGIFVHEGWMLTIEGKGSLDAMGGFYAAGIGGGGQGLHGGDVMIDGGTVTATGGYEGAGIGGGGVCGNITITDNVTKVTAVTNGLALYSVGRGYDRSASVGTITIGGVVMNDIRKSPYVYVPPIIKITEKEDGKYVVINGAYDGTDALQIDENITVENVVFNREFHANTYSTMVLPFAVNTAKLEGLNAVLYYNGIGTDKDGNDAVRMKVLWATNEWAVANNITKADGSCCKVYGDSNLTANTPYLVQMGATTLKVNGPVTIVPTTEAATELDGWKFRGMWEFKRWDSGDRELGYAYGFAASSPKDSKIKVGDFVKIGEGTYIYPLRAYLVSSNIPEPVQSVRANGAYAKRPTVTQKKLPELMSVIVDDEGDGKHTTVIGHFNTRTGEFKMNNAATKRTFDVKGRNVGNKANKARGAYYGKKTTARHPER